jgi:hypothetical protein
MSISTILVLFVHLTPTKALQIIDKLDIASGSSSPLHKSNLKNTFKKKLRKVLNR